MHFIEGERRALRREIIVFLVLASVLSWSVVGLIFLRIPDDFAWGNLEAVEGLFGNWPMLFGCGPMVSAVVVTIVFRGRPGLKKLLRKVVLWRVSPWWFLAALVLPVIPQWAGLMVWAKMTGTVLTFPAFTAYLSSWLQIALISALFFITEEMGWRGFMLPRVLASHEWIRASLIVGVVWAVWHYPLWAMESWAMSEPWTDAGLSLLVSSFRAIALSVLLTWIYKSTNGSILLAMLFHGSNNANFGKMFEVAGDAALQGPAFQAVQSGTALVLAALVVMIVKNKERRDFFSSFL